MNLRIRQVFVSQDNKLDPGCVPYSSVGRKPKFYENQHILDLIAQSDHLGADYWGLTSWRMESKSGLSHAQIKEKIEENKGYDVYLYNDWGDDFSLLKNKNLPFGKIVKRLYEIRAIPFENNNLDWVNVFLNFWVAKPYIVERYVGFLRGVVNAMETDPIISDILSRETYRHRGEQCPLHPFLLEYMFGLFLYHNPDVKYFRIPNTTTPYEKRDAIVKQDHNNKMKIYQCHLENAKKRGIGSHIKSYNDGDFGPYKISIVITARNYGKYLGDAIQSCLNQTVPCEIVYSDDCSGDDSLEIAHSFGIKVVEHPEHAGVAKARNDGAMATTGNILVFMDGDDIFPSNYIEKHLEVFDESVPFVYAAAQAFGSFETFWDVHAWGVLNIWDRNFINTSGMVWKDVFIKAGMWQDTCVDTMWDFHLALRMSRLGTPRKSDAVLLYRQHQASWSVNGKEKTDNQLIVFGEQIRREVVKVSVGLVYGGRIPNFFENVWIKNLVDDMSILNNKPELIIYNNSSEDLNKILDEYRDSFSKIKIISHPEKILFSSETDRRNKVATFLANAYNMLLENCTGDIIHLREDDVITPEGGFQKLFDFTTHGRYVPHAVAGAYFNRNPKWPKWIGGFFSNPIRSSVDIDMLPTHDPFVIDYTGTGCILFWKDTCPKLYKPFLDGVQAHDWAWCHDLKASGGKVWMLPSVICRHHHSETEFLQPFDKIGKTENFVNLLPRKVHGSHAVSVGKNSRLDRVLFQESMKNKTVN